jgi:DNA polymerase-3 subunit gamma/tau
LKTLEEPPEHVYFIFATTAPHKIPETIKSRCQRHHFKRLEIREIAGQLERICEAEGYKYDRGALRLLARKAEGSMRDGESLLDQCITASAGAVLADTVKSILGLLDQEMVFSFLEKITERNPTEVLRQLDRSIDEGVDLQELAGALLEGFRDLMILAAPGDMSNLLFRSKDEIAFLKKIVPSYELPDLVTIVERLCNMTPRLKSASDPRILLESVLVDISLLDRQVDIRDLLRHVQSGKPHREASSGSGNEGMEEDSSRSEPDRPAGGESGRGPSGGAKAAARVLNGEQVLFSGLDSEILERGPEREATGPASGVGEGRVRSQPQPEMPQDLSDVAILREYWDGFVTYVRQKKVSLGVCLISARLADFDGKTIRLEFPKGYLIQKEQVEKSDSVRSLKRMLEKYFRREMDIACSFASGQSRPLDDRAVPEHTRKAVPRGRRVIQDQPVVKKILEDFDGEIITYRP